MSNFRDVVENATVTVRGSAGTGQGVLVFDDLILTVAHLVSTCRECDKTRQDTYTAQIITKEDKLTAQVYAVEPIADVVVLGSPDDQSRAKDAICFFKFCRKSQAVGLYGCRIPKKGLSVQILTHTGKWIKGRAELSNGDLGVITVFTKKEIKGGTSGGPVVTEDGRLVSLVTCTSTKPNTKTDEWYGELPLLSQTLPVWAVRRIKDAE